MCCTKRYSPTDCSLAHRAGVFLRRLLTESRAFPGAKTAVVACRRSCRRYDFEVEISRQNHSRDIFDLGRSSPVFVIFVGVAFFTS
jgi:hypothetical protein